MVRNHVAAFDDLERREKHLGEQILAATEPGEPPGRAGDPADADQRAVSRLPAPDRCDDMAVYAVGPLHRVERGAVLCQHLAAARDALVVDEDVEIFPERLGEL